MLQNDFIRHVPEYYPYMHLDGFSPEEIRFAKKQQMLDEIESSEFDDEISVNIISEVLLK